MPKGIYLHKKGYKRPPRSKEWRRKLGLAHRGKVISDEQRKMLSEKLKGRVFTEEHKRKIGEILRGQKNTWSTPPLKKGKDHYNWKGGRSSLKQRILSMQKYKNWRLIIFKRDNFTCQFCGSSGNFLQADHYPLSLQAILNKFLITTIKEAENCPVLWDTNNGRTLCKNCHQKTPNYLWKSIPQKQKQKQSA